MKVKLKSRERERGIMNREKTQIADFSSENMEVRGSGTIFFKR